MGIVVKQRNKEDRAMKACVRMRDRLRRIDFHKYGHRGVNALRSYTPVDTGKTADSWNYKIVTNRDRVTIEFYNSNVNEYVPIALILQYGHATKNGGWVQGIDYINPAIQSVFQDMADEIWTEATRT